MGTMGKVIFNMSMSLDGFIAGPTDEGDALHKWYFAGDTEFGPFKVSRASAEVLAGASKTAGALVTGRRTFDVSEGWGGHPPLGVPCFVLTHRVPQEWVRPGSPFTFVTDGVESAIAQARAVAGAKNVIVGSATTFQQCLEANLLDEIHIDLVPVLLGAGTRLFAHLDTAIELEQLSTVEGTGVIHLGFRVVR